MTAPPLLIDLRSDTVTRAGVERAARIILDTVK